ncbi:NAD(P)H-hydrate dehydratase [Demequina sp. TTPB684]|uniref:NAD(P)H-hydrate dehydratase n=1 Tax=unclassified Demequina TaxID=2620311 RepID=UPI001CF5EC17|nr:MULTISPECIES: NAD(P)H-hydrate dehydratase [unclassified Demequina]MCB2411599.1 NAD(P)H-hydrate dehydratase [Demequina sp. TTPB684]UPU89064.1 NAD(P)H-hydrate dehydratase [Demequina sp. TMPB413]
MEPIDRSWVADRWPVPTAADDKFSRGVLGIVAGSEAYPGAAALVASAAVRTGIGLVRYVGPRRAQDLVLSLRPEVVVHDSGEATERLPRVSAWVIGPGVADHPGQDAVIGAVLASGTPIVVDAGALEPCARARAAGARQAAPDRVLMTPHMRELVATLGSIRHDVTERDVERDRPAHARLLAETARATVLLKGSATVVAPPGGAVVTLPDATPWLATAGAGDVLAGIAGALLASGLSALDAGVAASWIHARAAEAASGGGPIAALDIAEAVPAVVAELLLENA